MFAKLKCKLGIHKWTHISSYQRGGVLMCEVCGKKVEYDDYIN